VIVTGFTEAEATERWEILARRAEIGALVEEMCRNGSLNGPLKVFPSRLVDGPVRVSLVTFSGVRNGEARTLLESLRSLAAEIGGNDEFHGDGSDGEEGGRMTPERLEELRALCRREYGVSPSIACEMLAEIDRLRAAVERVKALPSRPSVNGRGLWLDRCDVLAALEASDPTAFHADHQPKEVSGERS
jgi:hypothetical protein